MPTIVTLNKLASSSRHNPRVCSYQLYHMLHNCGFEPCKPFLNSDTSLWEFTLDTDTLSESDFTYLKQFLETDYSDEHLIVVGTAYKSTCTYSLKGHTLTVLVS